MNPTALHYVALGLTAVSVALTSLEQSDPAHSPIYAVLAQLAATGATACAAMAPKLTAPKEPVVR